MSDDFGEALFAAATIAAVVGALALVIIPAILS